MIAGPALGQTARPCAYICKMRTLYISTCSAVPGPKFDLCSSSAYAKPGWPSLSFASIGLSLWLLRRFLVHEPPVQRTREFVGQQIRLPRS